MDKMTVPSPDDGMTEPTLDRPWVEEPPAYVWTAVVAAVFQSGPVAAEGLAVLLPGSDEVDPVRDSPFEGQDPIAADGLSPDGAGSESQWPSGDGSHHGHPFDHSAGEHAAGDTDHGSEWLW